MTLWNSLGSQLDKARRRERWRPRLEVLESRTLLSVFTVDHLTDDGMGSGLAGDLRYCLTNATSGQDIITFGVTGTINLTGALPDLTASVRIAGPGANRLTVRRNTGGRYRVFTVPAGVTVHLAGLTVANGYPAGLDGGGINNKGTLTVEHSAITGNAGLGIFNTGTLTVTSSTVSGNMTGIGNDADEAFGGGVYNNGSLTVTNSTIAGNTANGFFDGYGGGIYNQLGTLTVTNSTISGNTAFGQINPPFGEGGGIYNFGNNATINMHNSILAGNHVASYGPPDLSGHLTSSGYNLIGKTSGGSGFDSTDLLNVDPQLGPLQNNGGPTQTMALLPGSPAIDAGDNTGAPRFDQRGRGYHRIVNGTIDIGAFEVQNAAGAPDSLVSLDPLSIQVAVTPTQAMFPSTCDQTVAPVLPTLPEILTGPPARLDATSPPAPLVPARDALGAGWEGLGDPRVDMLAGKELMALRDNWAEPRAAWWLG
jgi:hypothetical protein